MILLVFIIYSILSTCIIFFEKYRNRSQDTLRSTSNFVKSAEIDDFKKAELRIELIKANKDHLAWYETGISTIGLVGFFSMTIAVGFNTLTANHQKKELKDLKENIKKLEKKNSTLNKISNRISREIIFQHQASGKIDIESKKILRERLAYYAENRNTDKIEIPTLFEAALLLGQLDLATSILEDYPEIFDSIKLVDRLSIAEYHFILGYPRIARRFVEKISGGNEITPANLALRKLVLEYVLGLRKDINDQIHVLSGRLKMSQDEVSVNFERKVKSLRDRAVYVRNKNATKTD